ncbi:MAG: sporulation membrane protein YtaF [Clostridiales bacterium]|nr:sporulation membrane protein YtaF [Clostridiales bacterium]
MFSPAALAEAALLVVALSLDAFAASFSYGLNRIRIPFLSAQIINGICAASLGAALFLGKALAGVLPASVAAWITFAFLFVLGLIKLCDSLIARAIRRHRIERNISFKFLSLTFILHVYAEPEKADWDGSRVLSPAEAACLAVALSLDGLGAGFGAGLARAHPLPVIAFSLIVGYAAIALGCFLGKKAAEKLRLDVSWLSGVILLGLAIMKIIC